MATDLPPHERASWLAQQCGTDVELRAKVEALLEHFAAAEGVFLAEPAYSASQDDLPPEPKPPRRIGNYTIVRKIGEGGMGIVYEARQEHPSRTVALKIIKLPLFGGASAALVRRFEREAEVLGQLQHHGIAQIYEAGVADVELSPDAGAAAPTTTADGVLDAGTRVASEDHAEGVPEPARVHVRQPFFAMELVRGPTLTEYADQHHLGTRDRLELVAKVCDAVQHAHSKGVVHRDLKPGNILVVDEGIKGSRNQGIKESDGLLSIPRSFNPLVPCPKVLDFGVARITQADVQTLTLQTDVGQLVGTVPYMSPEQVSGEAATVDARSDIYSLGVVIYELLTGQLPYDLRDRSLPEAARIVREAEPSRLSSINPLFRGDIETIVSKALEKDRQRRYQSSAELAGDIRRYLHDEPIVARPASRMYRMRKFARRHRGLVAGVALAFAALTVGLIGTSVMATREFRQRQLAQRERDAARRQAYRADLAAAYIAVRNQDHAVARRHLEATPRELRGWEWQHLNWVSDRSLATFQVPASGVQAIALTPDERFLLTAHADGGVRFLDLESGQVVRAIQTDPPCSLDQLAISPSGDRLLMACVRTGCSLWDLTHDRELWQLSGSVCATAQSFNHDGTEVAVGIRERLRAAILDAATGRELRTIPLSGLDIHDIGFSPDGRHLAYVSDYEVRVVEVESGRQLWRNAQCLHAAFTPDSRRVFLAGASARGQCAVVDARTGEPSASLTSEPPKPGGVRFDSDGRLAVLSYRNGAVVLADTHTGAELATPFRHANAAHAIIAAHSRRLITVGGDGDVKVWSADTTTSDLLSHQLLQDAWRSPDASSDLARLVHVGFGGVTLWDTSRGIPLWTRVISRRLLHAAAFSPDDERLAVGGIDGAVRILSASDGRVLSESMPFPSPITSALWLPDGQRIIAGLADGSVHLVSAGSPADQAETLCRHGTPVNALALSPDGAFLIIGDTGGWLRGYALPRGTAQPSLSCDLGRGVTALAFAPNSLWIVAATQDGAVHLLAADDRSARTTLSPGGRPVASVMVSPDGQRIAAGLADGTIKLWNTDSGEELLAMSAPTTSAVTYVGFSPDGRTLLASSSGAAVMKFETGPPAGGWRLREQVRRARSAVDPLFEKLMFADAVVQALQAELSPADPVRDLAIEITRGFGDHANWLNSHAWEIARLPSRTPEQYELAVRKVSLALQSFPDDYGMLNTLGAAQYRVGQYEAALTTLARCVELHTARHGQPHPIDVALIAMCHDQLGDHELARDHFERARGLMQSPNHAAEAESQSIFREAESLLEPEVRHDSGRSNSAGITPGR